MTHDEFRAEVGTFLIETERMIGRKNADYAGKDASPFAAFYAAAEEAGITVEQAWYVFVSKHLRSLSKWVQDEELVDEQIISRLMDIAAYCAILAAHIKETCEVDENTYDQNAPGPVEWKRLPDGRDVPLSVRRGSHYRAFDR